MSNEAENIDNKALAIIALQKILDYQMPTGEWGNYNVSLRDRYLRVGHIEHDRQEYLALFRKPNGYRTLTAMEILKDYCGNKFNHRIRNSIYWFRKNLSSGWFGEWDAFGTGPSPDRSDIPHIEKTPDVRHTAQALLALLKFDRNPGPDLQKGLYNILNCQLPNGMWPRKPNFNHTEILRSVCCADLLFHSTHPIYKPKLIKLGLNDDFFQKARISLDLICAWLIECAKTHNNLWIDEYQTAMVLERIGPWLLADRKYYHTVESAVGMILGRMTSEGWMNSGVRETRIRFSELSRYETTIRVCASLYIIRNKKLWISDDELQQVRGYLQDHFQPEEIDSSDYRYFLRIFYPDFKEFFNISQSLNFYDYLNVGRSNDICTYTNRHFLINIMSIWINDCLERLGMLVEGRALGIVNYDQAFLEKEEELLKVLNTMRLATKNEPTEQLASSLLKYIQTGDIQTLYKQFEEFCVKYSIQYERRQSRGEKVYHEARDLFIEILTRYLAQVSKK